MRASYFLLLVLGIAAAITGETSYVQAQSSLTDTPAIRKLREDLGLEPRSPDAAVAVNPPAPTPAPTPVPNPTPTSVTAADFKPAICTDDKFIIAFPAQHTFTYNKEEHLRNYSCVADSGKLEFAVCVADAPAQLNDSNIQPVFDAIRDKMVQNVSGRLISERNRPQGAHSGRELSMQFTASGQSGVRNLRFVFAEHRLYIIGVSRTVDLAPSVVAAFLDSFQIIDADQPTNLPAVAPAPAPATAAVTAADFKPVAFPNDKFVVAFPGKHEIHDDKEHPTRKYAFIANAGKLEFEVCVVDAPAACNDSNVQSAFDSMRDETLRAPGTRLISERNRLQAAHPGREIVVQLTAPGQSCVVNMWYVFAERRIYVLGATSPGDVAPSIVAAFLDSFQITDGNQATNPPAVAPAPAPATAAVTAADFKPVACADDKFVVAFPGKHEFNNNKDKHSRSYTCAADPGKPGFSVFVFDVQPEVNDSNVQQIFDGIRDRMVSSMSGSLVSELNRPQGTHPGREINMQAGTHGRLATSTHGRRHSGLPGRIHSGTYGQAQASVNMRLVFAEHRIYYIVVNHSGELAPSIVAAFFDSFQTVEAAPTTNPPAVAPAPVPAPVTADNFKHPTACVGDQFIIAFPGKMEFEKQQKSRTYRCRVNNGNVDFRVQVVDLPADFKDSNAQQYFDGLRDTLLQNPPSRLISDRDRPQATHPGREITMQVIGQSEVVTLWAVVAQGRLYVVAATHSGGLDQSVIAAFLGSFQTADTVQASTKIQEEFKSLFTE
jgi:hypothetical protein